MSAPSRLPALSRERADALGLLHAVRSEIAYRQDRGWNGEALASNEAEERQLAEKVAELDAEITRLMP